MGYEKMWKLVEKTTNKVTHTKNNQFGSKYVKSDRYSYENLLESCAVAYAVTQQPSEIKWN